MQDEKNKDIIVSRDAEIQGLKAIVESAKAAVGDQLRAYRDLLNIKIKQDSQIAAYQKILKSEEMR